MSKEEIEDILEELNLVRPEILAPKAKKLFEAIMCIEDERDKFQQEIQKLKKQLEEYKKWYKDELEENSKLSELWCNSRAKIRELENQQKEFINYINAYIELLKDKPDLVEEG